MRKCLKIFRFKNSKWNKIFKEGENVLLNRTLGNIKTDEYQFAVHIEYAKNLVLTMKKLENMESG
ncbi:hypothetical protein GCWU000323_01669 [Leptotrichia hofstadii F0254]|uniref:Uncharacterized protein n=1 Tax=Leptotrichia hofstadii F0254 TaxID=634994 RepID=C9MYN9_9FUSO|nr:hypothetical protein GCWU000323_01669 [Leptotrichia hofstadii F0254]